MDMQEIDRGLDKIEDTSCGVRRCAAMARILCAGLEAGTASINDAVDAVDLLADLLLGASDVIDSGAHDVYRGLKGSAHETI